MGRQPMKRFAIIVALLVLAACAVWQKLQIMAITAIIAVLALAYRDYTRQIFEVGLKLLRGTTQAKFGSRCAAGSLAHVHALPGPPAVL